MKKPILIGTALLLTLLLGSIFFLRGGLPAQATRLPPGGDFVLQSADGPVDTQALRGKILLIYFGYTHCPDISPTALATSSQALNTLAAEERARVRLLMVSLDPERDQLPQLQAYAAFFHPAMTGISGTPAEIERIAGNFGVRYSKQTPKADGSYVVDHTAATYVVGPDGKLAAVLDLGTPSETVVTTIRQLL